VQKIGAENQVEVRDRCKSQILLTGGWWEITRITTRIFLLKLFSKVPIRIISLRFERIDMTTTPDFRITLTKLCRALYRQWGSQVKVLKIRLPPQQYQRHLELVGKDDKYEIVDDALFYNFSTSCIRLVPDPYLDGPEISFSVWQGISV
jgi:hypothetical protein